MAAEPAELVVRLYEARLTEPYRSALRFVEDELAAASWAEVEERCPRGSEAHRALRTVLDHWELVGALLHAGAVDEELLFDATGEHLTVWSRVEPWLEDARAQLEDPRLLENLELLVRRHERWSARRPPKLARPAEPAG